MESLKMKISKLGIFVLVSMIAMLTGSCSFYYRVMSRKNLVDGAKAYNERKFDEAEEKFRVAAGYDPELTSFEGKTAQLFLARTLHSGFASDRANTKKAEEAIVEYKKTLSGFLNDVVEKRAAVEANPQDEMAKKQLVSSEKTVGSIVSAVAGLYENLQQTDKWNAWQAESAKNDRLPADVRANVFISLGAKEYNCANDISDDPAVKSTVEKEGEAVFEFKKPADEDFNKLKGCVDKGMEYIDNAIKLNGDSDSAWSYRTSLFVQKSRIAEMEGDSDSKESFKKQSEEAKKKFEVLAEKRRKAEEEEARLAAEAKAKAAGKKVSEAKPEEDGEAKPE